MYTSYELYINNYRLVISIFSTFSKQVLLITSVSVYNFRLKVKNMPFFFGSVCFDSDYSRPQRSKNGGWQLELEHEVFDGLYS